MAGNRDDFSAATKKALALRAGMSCAFDGCGRRTAGPSAEGPAAVNNIGVAAHICAAAPGGRRYDPAMSREARRSVENGIWLCQTCATIIDRDAVTYTAEGLHEMRRRHEARCSLALQGRSASGLDVIAVGPDIVATGTVISVGPEGWRLRLEAFVAGDAIDLARFVADFDQTPAEARYIVAGELGDGAAIRAAPSLMRVGAAFELNVPTAAPPTRVPAAEFGSTFAISPDTGDFVVENGRLAMRSGIEAFAVHLERSLSLAKGADIFHQLSGTMISDYYHDYSGSPWLARLIRLEIIRVSSIELKDGQTPLRAVRRVREVMVLSDQLRKQRLSLRVVLDLEGHPRWAREIGVFIYSPEQLDQISEKEPELAAAIGWRRDRLPIRPRRSAQGDE